MRRDRKMCFDFASFRLDPAERLLWRDGEILPLTPKLFDILLVLVENSGRLLNKNEFQSLVWPETVVEDGNLTRNISTLRKILGETLGEPRYIETIPWRGYRFVAKVDQVYEEAPNPAIDSIVVLPFVNGGDHETEYLADGITESLINNLSRLSHLKVISRRSAFRYKGRELDAPAIGRELRVGALLTGSILPQSNTLIISAELVDARDDTQIWGERYHRDLTDIFALQETIARIITEKLRLTLTSAEESLLHQRLPLDAAAYQLYLKGRYHFHRLTPEEVAKGIEYLRQAIEREPDYALAHVGLSDCYNYLARPVEALAEVKKALELEPTLGEAHASMAFHQFVYDWNFQESELGFQRAIALSPNYANAHHWYAIYLANLGRHDEAIREARKAEALDPISPLMSMTPGLVFYCAHAYEEALAEFQKVSDLDPNFMPARSLLGHVYEQQGLFEKAIGKYVEVLELVGNKTPAASSINGFIGRIEAKRGRKDEARRIAADLSPHSSEMAYTMAEIHAALGEIDQAFDWLDRAYENHNFQLVSLKVDPNLDALRADQRFGHLLRRMALIT